jgi:hypothetical protein
MPEKKEVKINKGAHCGMRTRRAIVLLKIAEAPRGQAMFIAGK